MNTKIKTKEEAIDIINDAINTKLKENYGVDICLTGVEHLINTLITLYTRNENVLTHEATFDDQTCFCWGKTKQLHKAWVNSH